jgi:hypothetical protein
LGHWLISELTGGGESKNARLIGDYLVISKRLALLKAIVGLAPQKSVQSVEINVSKNIQTKNVWGLMPILILVASSGLLILALANNAARQDNQWAELIFWGGVIVLYLPITIRLLMRSPTRQERFGLVVALGMGLYILKVLQYPLFFTYHDEIGHWRTADDIMQTGHLFDPNPVVNAYSLYPGLMIVTNALVHLSGLSIFESGILILGVARLIFALTLFIFFEKTAHSARLAGIAMVIYFSNPNFVFFDAQYAYETLAIPMLALVLFLLQHRKVSKGWNRAAFGLAAVITIGALVATHHVSSYILIVFLALWTVCGIAVRLWYRRPMTNHMGSITLVTLVLVMSWLLSVATLTLKYLAPVITKAIDEFIRLASGQSESRQLFQATDGKADPLWEQLLGFGSVGLVLMGLPFGLILLWQRRLLSETALTLAMGAMAYPITLGMRFTEAGAETSNRASEFLFVSLAFIIAFGITNFQLSRFQFLYLWLPMFKGLGAKLSKLKIMQNKKLRGIIFLVGITTAMLAAFLGGIIVGWSPRARLPGPYLITADQRSIEYHGIEAAFWARNYLGSENRILTDRINGMLMGSYGRQRPQWGLSGDTHISQLFNSKEIGPDEIDIIINDAARYLVVDKRISGGVPLVGYYFDKDEPMAHRYKTPITLEALTKFDKMPSVSRIFDDGNIAIYDVKNLFSSNRVSPLGFGRYNSLS